MLYVVFELSRPQLGEYRAMRCKAQMTQPEIRVYGALWCPDCRRAKQFLDERQIPYEWYDIEKDKEARDYVQQVNNGLRIIPTLVFADGSVLTEPSNRELAEKLGSR